MYFVFLTLELISLLLLAIVFMYSNDIEINDNNNEIINLLVHTRAATFAKERDIEILNFVHSFPLSLSQFLI